MAAPKMAAITASIERSLQNCSLSSDTNNNNVAGAGGQAKFRGGRSTISESAPHNTTRDFADNILELNSQIRLPYYWEQCLDLKTGEVYYINWRTGMKSPYDPRMMNPEMNVNIGDTGVGRLISSEEELEEENDQSSNDSQGSSTEKEGSSPSPSSSTTTSRSEQYYYNIPGVPGRHLRSDCESENESSSNDNYKERRQQVLVVAGCKGCFMYFMVPKQVEDCPKCFGQLLHFDRSEDGSP